ncbi:hypothetical protein [Klebsiella pneumoniae]|nr:hypothetical protein [Klebsiella pneumoniae]
MPGLEEKEYLGLFDKVFKDRSFNGEDIYKYDRFISNVFSFIDCNL